MVLAILGAHLARANKYLWRGTPVRVIPYACTSERSASRNWTRMKATGTTQEVLAEKIGVSQQSISAYPKGRAVPLQQALAIPRLTDIRVGGLRLRPTRAPASSRAQRQAGLRTTERHDASGLMRIFHEFIST